MPSPSRCGLALALAASWAAAVACRSAAGGASGDAPPGEAIATRRPVEDVFLLTGEMRAVRSVLHRHPARRRAPDPLDGRRRHRRQGRGARDRVRRRPPASRTSKSSGCGCGRRRTPARARSGPWWPKAIASGWRSRRPRSRPRRRGIDADVPNELRAAVEWRQMQAAYQEKKAALEKARLDQEAFRTSSRSDLEVLRRTEEKARRETDVAEKSVAGMSVFAPKNGIFLVGNFWQWGPEGPRKLQPGDTVWPGFPVAQIPDPSEMEVSANALRGRSRGDHRRDEGALHSRHLPRAGLRRPRRGGGSGGRRGHALVRAGGRPDRVPRCGSPSPAPIP